MPKAKTPTDEPPLKQEDLDQQVRALTIQQAEKRVGEKIGKLDGVMKITRNLARYIGALLIKIKAEKYENDTAKFNSWFEQTFHRTSQSALKWIRLSKVWVKKEELYKNNPPFKNRPWTELSIDETLGIGAKARTKPSEVREGSCPVPVGAEIRVYVDGKHFKNFTAIILDKSCSCKFTVTD